MTTFQIALLILGLAIVQTVLAGLRTYWSWKRTGGQTVGRRHRSRPCRCAGGSLCGKDLFSP